MDGAMDRPSNNETIAPTPYRAGGPPIWGGGMVPAALQRAVRHFDGWLPNGPHPRPWAEQWAALLGIAADQGRDPKDPTGAVYVTLCVDENSDRAEERVGRYLEQYYGRPAELLKQEHTYYAGAAEGVAEWLTAYAEAGVGHLYCALPATTITSSKPWQRCAATLAGKNW